MSTMDWILVALEGLLVVGFIALGVRSGGVGLGLWGGVGTLVLVFLFGLDPGEPPISAMLIIIAVIAAAAAMQAAGGIDYMVMVAAKALRARPKALNFAAPYVSWLLTILTGTGNTFFSLIPVINELAYANKIRPERALAGSAVASTFGITASPVAAAMATMLPLVEPFGFDIVDVMLITIPASLIGIFAMALFMNGYGKDLDDDAEYQRRRALHLRRLRGPAPDGRRRGRRGRAHVGHAADPDVHALRGRADPAPRARAGQRHPGHADLQVRDGRDDRAVRDRLDGGHLHRQQRGRDRQRPGQPRRELADHDRDRDLPRRRIAEEPVGRYEDDDPARARARDRRGLHDRDVDRRRRRALPPGERHADRCRRGRQDGHDGARQARDRPLVPASASDRLGRHPARRLPHRLPLLRRPHPGTAGAHHDDHPVGMSARGAAFLGIGAMVGAGIFALLGEAGAVAGSAVWISFLLAGIVSALLGYTVVKMGVRFPSSGGLIAYLIEGFGNGRLVGIASWLGYFAAIVIVCSMVAVSFGSYATSLFIGEDAAGGWDNLFTTLVVVAMAGINIVGSKIVDRAQSLIVVLLLAVFAVFIVVTLADINLDLLAFSGYPSVSDIIASVALTFFAYLGFSVITFTVGDLRDPTRELPRAMYLALAVTTLTYVLISIGVFGTLTVEEVTRYGETAIAEAARPALG